MTTSLKIPLRVRLAEGKTNKRQPSKPLRKKRATLRSKTRVSITRRFVPLSRNVLRMVTTSQWSYSEPMSDNEQLLREVNKMAEKKNEVAEKKSAEIIQFDPTMFEDDAGMGMENMGQEDLALPFLKILSGLDPLLDTMRQPVRVTYTIPSQEPFTAARRASRSFRVPTSVGSSNGPLEARNGRPDAIYAPGEAMPKPSVLRR